MSPILGHIGGVALHAYGTFLGLAFAAGWIAALLEAQRRGLVLERVAGCFLIAGASALVMSRVLWVITNPGQPALGLQGLVAYGGFLGGALGVVVGAKLMKVPVLAWADCAAPATAVGLVVTRVGCFFNGCCYGKPTDLPWGVHFPSVPGVVHPTQLYESALGLLVVVPITYLAARRAPPGGAAVAFFLSYAPMRFLIEIIRDDPDRGQYGPLSTSQWIAIGTTAIGLVLAKLIRDHARNAPAPAAPVVASAPAAAPSVASSAVKKKRKKRK